MKNVMEKFKINPVANMLSTALMDKQIQEEVVVESPVTFEVISKDITFDKKNPHALQLHFDINFHGVRIEDRQALDLPEHYPNPLFNPSPEAKDEPGNDSHLNFTDEDSEASLGWSTHVPYSDDEEVVQDYVNKEIDKITLIYQSKISG